MKKHFEKGGEPLKTYEEYANLLKTEAVKWGKKARKLEDKYLDAGNFAKASFHAGACQIVMMINNLTEEDLK